LCSNHASQHRENDCERDWDERERELVAAISEAVEKFVIDWPLPRRLDPNVRLVA